MLHDHLIWLWYAVAALMLVDAVAYTFGAISPIRRALNRPSLIGRSGCSLTCCSPTRAYTSEPPSRSSAR
jgi:hypothetical protein